MSEHLERRERYLNHTDRQRAEATVAARLAQADLKTAEKRFNDAVRARDRAAYAMYATGIPKTTIARVLGLRAHSNVDKLLDRVNGADIRAARKLFERIGKSKAIKAAEILEKEAP